VNPLYAGAGGALVLMAVFGLGYHFGAEAYRLDDATATVQQLTHNATQESKDAQQINEEAAHLAAAALDPVAAPVVRVYYPPPAAVVSRATASGPIPACPSLPAGHPADPLPAARSVDIGKPLVQLGHDADAQIDQLLDYIDHVCRVPAPP